MKALVIGATGAVGKDLVVQLLADQAYEQVDVFVRRHVGIQHPKLVEHVIDFEKPETWQDQVRGDVLFSCLGTTLKAAGGQKPQWRVDHDYQLAFANAAVQGGVSEYMLVSSIGANARSINFYTRMKGVLEDEVKALPFVHIGIVQPPSLIRKGSDRPAEKLTVRVLQALNSIGLMRSLMPMDTAIVASAMRALAANGKIGVEIVSNQDIRLVK